MANSRRVKVGTAALAGASAAVLLLSLSPGARADKPATVLPARADDFLLSDQDYQAHQLSRMKDARAVVLVTYAAGSKVVAADAAAISALQATYAPKGVEMFLLDSVAGETRATVRPALERAGLKLPVLFDYEQLVGEQLGVTRAGEVIVLDPRTWKVAYRGPVGEGEQHWAADAIAAVSAGSLAPTAFRPARGEPLVFAERDRAASFDRISYTHEIAPLIQAKCTGCHQPGGIAPMALNTYDQIKGFSPMIREVIRTKRMPPYRADETVGAFADDARLSPKEMKTLVHWVEAGSPRGEGADPLAKIKFQAPEWPLGKPDVIVDVPEVAIAATGVMDYQRPVVKNVMTEGRWMKATTFRISDRKVVHHILTGVVDGDGGPTKTATETEWGASLGGYGPGRGSNLSPTGMGTWVPPSGGIAFQNHYTPYGKATTEKTQMGLYFYKKGEEPKYVMRTMGIFDPSITIPANTERHHELAYLTFPKEAVLYGLTPHAHHRGAATSVSVRYPDGHEEMLLALPRYDFNWQYEYFLKTPLKVPAGSKVIARWTYDNSKRNPANPDPNRDIAWGEQSSEEMLATYLHYRWTDETVKHQLPDYDKALQGTLLMGMLDDNLDGKLEKAELKGRPGEMIKTFFALIDKNKDGVLDAEELAAAQKLMAGRGLFRKPADGVVQPVAAKPVTTASR